MKLSKKLKLDIFKNALCNGLGEFSGYGLELYYSDNDYDRAKEYLKKNSTEQICYEDVLVAILEIGGALQIFDHEGDSEIISSVKLEDMLDNMDLACEKQTEHILDMINEQDDAITADVVLQMVFFKDIIFG